MSRVYSQTFTTSPYRLVPATVANLRTTVTEEEPEESEGQLLLGGQGQGGRKNFAKAWLKRCGILQVFCGIISVILGTVAWIIKDAVFTFMFSAGIFAGIFLIISGSLAIDSTRTEKVATIIACLVMSVFTVIFSLAYFVVSLGSCWLDFTPMLNILESRGPIGAINVLGAILGLLGIVVAIVQIVLCSQTLCKCCMKRDVVVMEKDHVTDHGGAPPSYTRALLPSFGSINTMDYRRSATIV